MTAYKIEITQE